MLAGSEFTAGHKQPDGNWTGMLGFLQRDAADMLPVPMRTDAFADEDIPFVISRTVMSG